MLARQRYHYILTLLKEERVVSVKQLQGMFDISSMTLWRDLKFLESEGLLKRIHGGVCLNENAPDFNSESVFDERVRNHSENKKAIGFYAAAKLVKPGDIIILDDGTTVASMVPFLKDTGVTVLTNSLEIINRALRHIPESRVFTCGGMLKADTRTFVGPEAENFFERHSCGTAFISCGGITQKDGLTDPDPLDNEVKKKMIANAEKVIVLADSSKFGIRSLLKFASFDDIDIIVTDDELPPSILSWLKETGVKVEVAEPIGALDVQ